LEQEVIDWALDDIKRANELVAGEIYLEGLTNVLRSQSLPLLKRPGMR